MDIMLNITLRTHSKIFQAFPSSKFMWHLDIILISCMISCMMYPLAKSLRISRMNHHSARRTWPVPFGTRRSTAGPSRACRPSEPATGSSVVRRRICPSLRECLALGDERWDDGGLFDDYYWSYMRIIMYVYMFKILPLITYIYIQLYIYIYIYKIIAFCI